MKKLKQHIIFVYTTNNFFQILNDIRAVSCQVMSPGLSSVVSSTPVEGAPGATNLTRPALVPAPLHFHTPAH